MLAYCKSGVVVATHDEAQGVPASAYGAGTVIIPCPTGTNAGAALPQPSEGDLFAYAAARRRQAEDGGANISGMLVPTDAATRTVLTAAYVKAAADAQYVIADWKSGAGVYTTLTAAQIIAIANAVEQHVAACFAVNRTADSGIQAGTITSYAQIDALAWPSNT